jgi:hypothetical protein
MLCSRRKLCQVAAVHGWLCGYSWYHRCYFCLSGPYLFQGIYTYINLLNVCILWKNTEIEDPIGVLPYAVRSPPASSAISWHFQSTTSLNIALTLNSPFASHFNLQELSSIQKPHSSNSTSLHWYLSRASTHVQQQCYS